MKTKKLSQDGAGLGVTGPGPDPGLWRPRREARPTLRGGVWAFPCQSPVCLSCVRPPLWGWSSASALMPPIHFLSSSFLPTTAPTGLSLEAQLPQVSFLGLWESSVLIYLFQSSCKPSHGQQQRNALELHGILGLLRASKGRYRAASSSRPGKEGTCTREKTTQPG